MQRGSKLFQQLNNFPAGEQLILEDVWQICWSIYGSCLEIVTPFSFCSLLGHSAANWPEIIVKIITQLRLDTSGTISANRGQRPSCSRRETPKCLIPPDWTHMLNLLKGRMTPCSGCECNLCQIWRITQLFNLQAIYAHVRFHVSAVWPRLSARCCLINEALCFYWFSL